MHDTLLTNRSTGTLALISSLQPELIRETVGYSISYIWFPKESLRSLDHFRCEMDDLGLQLLPKAEPHLQLRQGLEHGTLKMRTRTIPSQSETPR